MTRTAGAVFSEYLVFNTLPKDIADMHLAGEINISNAGVWGLLPDTIFIDLSELEDGLDLKGRLLGVTRISAIKNSDDAMAAFPAIVSLLSREVSSEVVIEGVVPVILKNVKDPEEIASRFARMLVASSAAPLHSSGTPVTTIAVPELDGRQLNGLLDGYRKYVDATPIPRIGLVITGRAKESLDHVAAAVRSGGIISISNAVRANSGIRKAGKGAAAMTLHSLSINLPRLAYESNKDETYFRAKLALMIKPSLAAMTMRKKTITDYVKKGLIPSLASATQSMQRGTTAIVVNLTGASESVYNILGEPSTDVLQKVLKTAVEVAATQGKQLGEEGTSVSMVSDDSGGRFASLDSEKYGKVSLLQSQNTASYSQGMTLNGKEILTDRASIQECAAIDRLLNGGFAASLDVTDLTAADLKSAIEVAGELPFLRPRIKLAVCTACGRRSKASVDRCDHCKSPYKLLTYS
jgi:ribonucleoside-triphosphate reductase